MSAADRRPVVVAALLLGGGAGVGFSWVVAHHTLVGSRWRLILLLALWVPPWLVAGWAAVRVSPEKTSLTLILTFAILANVAAATASVPSISNDVYRYGWDAHVQLAGIDPYRYPPDSPQLESLRVAPWWPSPSGCRALGTTPGCTVINRPGDRTIYPAVAEAWFDIVGFLYPGHSGSLPWQLVGGVVDDLIILGVMLFLRRSGRDPRQAVWYALSPVPIVEFAGNGHVDGLALLLLVAAWLALQRDRRALAGFLIGGATMVKLYPAIALVAALRRGRVRLLVAAVSTMILAELPHVIAVGAHVLGYLPGYLKEEHYDSGTRFLLVGILPLPGPAVTVLAVAAVVGSGLYVWRRRLEPTGALAALLAVLILVTTPVQPWYAVSLAGVGALAGADWLVLPAMAGEVYYATVILADPHQVGYGRLAYGLAAVAVVILAWIRRHPDRTGRGQRLKGSLDCWVAGSYAQVDA